MHKSQINTILLIHVSFLLIVGHGAILPQEFQCLSFKNSEAIICNSIEGPSHTDDNWQPINELLSHKKYIPNLLSSQNSANIL